MNNLEYLSQDLDNFSVSTSHECEIEECEKFLPSASKGLTIVAQNIRSINKNMSDFDVLLHRLNISCDYIILTECWLSKTATIPKLDGYATFQTRNNPIQNDGVVAYI